MWRHRGFTDKVYFLNFIVVMIIVQECILLIFLSGFYPMVSEALSTIQYIVSCAFVELGLHTGLIVWKAKYENGRKFKDVNLLNKLDESVVDTSLTDVTDQVMAIVNSEEAVG